MAPPATKSVEGASPNEEHPPPFDFNEWEKIWGKDWGSIAEQMSASPEEIDQARANQQLAKEAWSKDFYDRKDKAISAKRKADDESRKSAKKQDSRTRSFEDYSYDVGPKLIGTGAKNTSSGLHLRGGGSALEEDEVDYEEDEFDYEEGDWPTYQKELYEDSALEENEFDDEEGDWPTDPNELYEDSDDLYPTIETHDKVSSPVYSTNQLSRADQQRRRSSSPRYPPFSPRYSTSSESEKQLKSSSPHYVPPFPKYSNPSESDLAPKLSPYVPKSRRPSFFQNVGEFGAFTSNFGLSQSSRKIANPSKFWMGRSLSRESLGDVPTSPQNSSSQLLSINEKKSGPSSSNEAGNTISSKAKTANESEQNELDVDQVLKESAAFPDILNINVDQKAFPPFDLSLPQPHQNLSSADEDLPATPAQSTKTSTRVKKVAFDLSEDKDEVASTTPSDDSSSSTSTASNHQAPTGPPESSLLTAAQPHALLPRSDQEYSEAIHTLKHFSKVWCNTYFTYKLIFASKPNSHFNLPELANMSPELITYANYITSGNPNWEDLFLIPNQRAALVYGILGKVLEVWVFGPLLFGATKEQTNALEALENVCAHVDGFERTSLRSHIIKSILSTSTVPLNFETDLHKLTMRLYTMLQPLFEPSSLYPSPITTPSTSKPKHPTWWSPTPPPTPSPPNSPTYTSTQKTCILSLHQILTHAARLAINMRLESTIYYLIPASKNTPYSPSEMNILNRTQVRIDGERIQRKKEEDKHLLVKVVCFPMIVAYRKGNGREGGREDGFRTRDICKADVWLHWARSAGVRNESLRERVEREKVDREEDGRPGCKVM
ncbi:MAG: hypothetical protein M1812_003499 [Candelaria pacifica]|nr:MAG: hypothetical protein M1812_003499 [Candelaria pacifica]